MSATVHVQNISSQTSEKEVRDFFSFCGKITSLSVTPSSADPNSPKSAAVTFEKETAAKTALLLDNTQLGPSQVQVSAAHSIDEIVPGHVTTESSSKEDHDIEQEDKPRSRIVAEYLAHGYVIGDNAIQKAIELDKKHGISAKFTNALQNFDSKYHATDKAKSMDTTYGVTNKAATGWRSLAQYFEKALDTPTGQRVRTFYTQSNKQALDIHQEARRLADLRKAESSGTAGATHPHGGEASSAGVYEPTAVPGTEKTTCKCGGSTEVCGCEAGKCACASCPKSTMDVKQVPGTTKTVCSCEGNEGACKCAPGSCNCKDCAK